VAISVLEAWGVFRADVAGPFRKLAKLRNAAIHFRPEVDTNDRALALEAVKLLAEVINEQFGGFGRHPWFIPTDGLSFIKKEWESAPFIRRVYVPNCFLVGPKHDLELGPNGWVIRDDHTYEDREISDDEFIESFRQAHRMPVSTQSPGR
jgi:hypothetical protein